ncbi:uncharacterized protein TRIVIDRAFT_222691 [Trichoderma virens Gv29-8]|uniref:Uncharacterized protein n=1 Tax=Hypocrea virens (strain Gv29-8 / FGSC 10586) TaxID=413071 RepID=G9MUP4_HYPVG|nr:uncharacterized protein TRIVIDRAFT_222691 [Trichoderma virens Gv29-8]EHK21841.1 hypothetical protein TRIVIDRAFT_222691 [Trichoderma virens Gv29-8]UKZ54334.1 hypothetical protein TrVGV298_008142 [Trichoderma virens]
MSFAPQFTPIAAPDEPYPNGPALLSPAIICVSTCYPLAYLDSAPVLSEAITHENVHCLKMDLMWLWAVMLPTAPSTFRRLPPRLGGHLGVQRPSSAIKEALLVASDGIRGKAGGRHPTLMYEPNVPNGKYEQLVDDALKKLPLKRREVERLSRSDKDCDEELGSRHCLIEYHDTNETT